MDDRRPGIQTDHLNPVALNNWSDPLTTIAATVLVAVVALTSGCGADAPHHAAQQATVPTQAPLQTPPPSTPPSPQPPASTPPPAPPPAPAPKMNVIVLMVDSMRSDMPWQGYERNIAPNLTKLASESVSYSRAYSLSSYTAMSVGGFLAGRYPGELKRSGYFFSAHPEDELFFPELLQKAGVRTLAAHAHFYFKPEKAGFHQGFDDYRLVADLRADNSTDRNVTSPQHVDLAIDMLKQQKNTAGQFFAWFHLMDPHDVYVKHDGFPAFGRGGMRGRYDGEMYFTDHHIGRLLSFIKTQPWADHTAIIVTADHGEAFNEHKMSRHGFELWESIIHVPLLVHIPKVAARVIDKPRSHIDLAPTIMDLMEVPADADFRGTSLVKEVRAETEPPPRDVIIDLPRTSDNFRRRALIHGQYKIIAFGDDFRYQLYDIVADPGERQDLRGRKKDVYKDMKRRYLDRVKQIKDICPKMRRKLKGKRPERSC